MHLLPGACCCWCSVHTVRNNTRSTWRKLTRAMSDNHFMLQHQSHGLTSLWCSCCLRAKPPCRVRGREREEGVKDELIWQSLHLLKNIFSFLMKICFSFLNWLCLQSKQDIYKGQATSLFPVVALVLTVYVTYVTLLYLQRGACAFMFSLGVAHWFNAL